MSFLSRSRTSLEDLYQINISCYPFGYAGETHPSATSRKLYKARKRKGWYFYSSWDMVRDTDSTEWKVWTSRLSPERGGSFRKPWVTQEAGGGSCHPPCPDSPLGLLGKVFLQTSARQPVLLVQYDFRKKPWAKLSGLPLVTLCCKYWIES